MRDLRLCTALALACSATGLVGCGEGSAPPDILAPVTGTVLVDEKPVAGVLVSFVPTTTTTGTGGYGVTDAEGKYSMSHRSGEPGIEPGTYKVVFSRMAMPDGSPVPPDQSAADVGAVESIPPLFSDLERTKQWDEIPAGGKTVDFKIKTK